jgi:hypothetical protein
MANTLLQGNANVHALCRSDNRITFEEDGYEAEDSPER